MICQVIQVYTPQTQVLIPLACTVRALAPASPLVANGLEQAKMASEWWSLMWLTCTRGRISPDRLRLHRNVARNTERYGTARLATAAPRRSSPRMLAQDALRY